MKLSKLIFCLTFSVSYATLPGCLNRDGKREPEKCACGSDNTEVAQYGGCVVETDKTGTAKSATDITCAYTTGKAEPYACKCGTTPNAVAQFEGCKLDGTALTGANVICEYVDKRAEPRACACGSTPTAVAAGGGCDGVSSAGAGVAVADTDVICAYTNGQAEAANCKCGSDAVAVGIGEGCDTIGNAAGAKITSAVTKCHASNDVVKNTSGANCACGTGVIVANDKWCYDNNGAGQQADACANTTGDVINSACGCGGGEYCPGPNFCSGTKCFQASHPEKCTSTNGRTKTAAICSCGKSEICQADEHCAVDSNDEGTCLAAGDANKYPVCTQLLGQASDNQVCACGDNLACAANQYCFSDGAASSCGAAKDQKACATDDSNLTEACTCTITSPSAGDSTLCAIGKHCTATGCAEHAKIADSKADGITPIAEVPNETGVMCGNTACVFGNYCLKETTLDGGYKCQTDSFACTNENATKKNATGCVCGTGDDKTYCKDAGTADADLRYCDADAAAAARCTNTSVADCATATAEDGSTTGTACGCGDNANCTDAQYCLVGANNVGSCEAKQVGAACPAAFLDGSKAIDTDNNNCKCGAADCPALDFCYKGAGATTAEDKYACVPALVGAAITKAKTDAVAAKTCPTCQTCDDDDEAGSAACIGQFVTTISAAMYSV